jgi:hypothetical protein
MTIVETSTAETEVGEAQLLFPEAKQRRRRRWLASGIVVVAVVGAVGITLGLTVDRGSGGSIRPSSPPLSAPATLRGTADFSVHPILCYAPPLTLATGLTASSGPLPTCSAASQLTPANLQVTPDPPNSNGYTSNVNIQEDPQFATYPSTLSTNDSKSGTLLLAASSGNQGPPRYVLGPAQMTGTAVKSANAQLNNGAWVVNLNLTGPGAKQWDTLAQQQFHALIGVVFDGRVIEAPITQPTQSSFRSSDGHLQISGAWTERQAKAFAAAF